MGALTYSGVYAFEHIFLYLNRFYMPVLMVAPMVVVMLVAMRQMFENKRLNIAIKAYADLDDPETIELCDQIVQTQRQEIAQMRDILERLD